MTVPKINPNKHVLKPDEFVFLQAISALIYLFIIDMIEWWMEKAVISKEKIIISLRVVR